MLRLICIALLVQVVLAGCKESPERLLDQGIATDAGPEPGPMTLRSTGGCRTR